MVWVDFKACDTFLVGRDVNPPAAVSGESAASIEARLRYRIERAIAVSFALRHIAKILM